MKSTLRIIQAQLPPPESGNSGTVPQLTTSMVKLKSKSMAIITDHPQ